MKKLLSFFNRKRLFTLLTVAVLLCALALNFGLTGAMRRADVYIDTTYEGLYTLSDTMKEVCAEVLDKEDAPKVRAIFCTGDDILTKVATYRVPYFMALQMANRFDNFTVETRNVSENPTSVAAYKTTSRTEIGSGHVILEAVYPDGHTTYRVATLASFWVTDTSSGSTYSYNGEYRIATLLYSILSVNKPTAYFLTGHGETVYDVENPESENSLATAELYDLLRECGLSVGVLDIENEEVPSDCVLMVLNNPTSDYRFDATQATSLSYRTALEKIDRYLIERQGALMVTRDYRASGLSNLDAFLKEWGFSFGTAQVTDEEECLADSENSHSILVAQYDEEDGSYGQAIYGEITEYASAARTVITNAGAINCSFRNTDGQVFESGAQDNTYIFAPFLSTSDAGKQYKGGELYAEGAAILAATTARSAFNTYDNTATYSYVFCASSGDFLSSKLLGETSFANRDVVALLVRNISRVDVFATGELGGSSLNYENAYGKVLYTPALYDEQSVILDNGAVHTVSEMTDASSAFNIADYDKSQIKSALTEGKRKAIVLAGCIAPLGLLVAGAYVLIKRKYR